MKKGLTIDDIAREAGVSRQTVSRAINNMNGLIVSLDSIRIYDEAGQSR